MLIGNLVETHCHILPGIDDGAPDVQISLKMIEALEHQGARAIILTPHYYSDSVSYEDFIRSRNGALQLLKSRLDSSVRLIPAAEIYISEYLFNNENLDQIYFGSSRYALIEHPFTSSFSQDSYDRIMSLIFDYKITPVLAHIERYGALMEDERLLDKYIDAGCLTQVNISSFAQAKRSTKKRLMKYLEKGKIHLIGSDCHNLDSRPPDYTAGAEAIIKKFGTGMLNQLEKNAAALLD